MRLAGSPARLPPAPHIDKDGTASLRPFSFGSTALFDATSAF